MQFRTRLTLAFNRLQRKYKVGRDQGLYQVSSLIRREAREKIRIRPKGAKPFPKRISAHTRGGIREINFHVQGSSSIIGARKFRGSNWFNRPVPNIHEFGGTAIHSGIRSRVLARYDERSYMWSAVKRLQRKGKIAKRFSVSLRRSW